MARWWKHCCLAIPVALALVHVLLWIPHKLEHFVIFSDESKSDLSFKAYTGYRLADMLTASSVRWGRGGEQFYFRWFPSSMASVYMRRTWQLENWAVLNDIIEERLKDRNSDCLMVHLRLGDVLDGSVAQPGLFHYYVINESFYQAYNPKGMSQVILFGNPWHNVRPDVAPEESFAYARRVQDIFRGKGLNSTLRLAEGVTNPEEVARQADEAVLLALSGSRLLISGGGFGRLLKRMAQHRGLPVDDPVGHAEGSKSSAAAKYHLLRFIQTLRARWAM